MDRYEIFNKAFSSIPYWNLFYQESDEELHEKWNSLSDEQRQQLVGSITNPEHSEDVLDFGGIKIPANDRIANAQEVSENYQYRVASNGLQHMPRLFRQVMMLADDDDMLDLMFLGTLGAMSICLPGVHGSLFREDILPNLYIFISGAAASGKGKVGLCRCLLDPINDSMDDSKLIIPANTSDTAFYEELNRNGGVGIMFESEADTLTQAFSKSSGKFSDGLRCAFHNEPITYLRRTKNERVYISHPVLSMLLTGTPHQIPLLLQSPENGLFSRILFYRLFSEKESFLTEDNAEVKITGEMVNDYLLTLGEEIKRFRERLLKKGDIKFSLTPVQNTIFMTRFHDASISYKELFEQAYGTAESIDHADAIMKRLGNICYRILMILSATRLMESEKDLPNEIVCNDVDFNLMIHLSEMFMAHTLIAYDELMVETGQIPSIEEEITTIDPNAEDLLNDDQHEFLKVLPDQFTKHEALLVARNYSLNVYTSYNYLSVFEKLGLVYRSGRGVYKKSKNEEEND